MSELAAAAREILDMQNWSSECPCQDCTRWRRLERAVLETEKKAAKKGDQLRLNQNPNFKDQP